MNLSYCYILCSFYYNYNKNYMNSSNAFSDYMVSYSVNRSFNISPTSGRLHKHKEKGSYGPTICLMNRSREKHQQSTTIQKKQEGNLQKIFMLMMEIQRLNHQIRIMKDQQQEEITLKKSREFFQMHEQHQKLKKSMARYENIQIINQKKYYNEVLQLKEKISLSEIQNKNLVIKLNEYQRQIEQLISKKRMSEQKAQKAKLQASRMQMSMHFNSTNIDLQKSMARQKSIQLQSLRQKIIKCQDIINDQKYLINGQKEELNKERMRQNQIQNKYKIQIQYMKKQVQFTQKQYLNLAQSQFKKHEGQLNMWKTKHQQLQQDFKEKCILIANQVRNLSQKDSQYLQLNQKVHDLQFQIHSKVTRAQQSIKLSNKQKERQIKKLNIQIKKYIQQNGQLKQMIQQMNYRLSEKETQNQKSSNDLQIRLNQKQRQIKKMIKKKHEQSHQIQQKMNKSLSVDNSLLTNRLKASQVNLEHIVSSVNQLKVSNERSNRLIGKTFNKAVKDIYYAD